MSEPAGAAPSLTLFGAFFPAWLICAVVGLAACLLLRAAIIALRFDDAIPLKLVVYTAFAVLVALTSWLALFGEA